MKDDVSINEIKLDQRSYESVSYGWECHRKMGDPDIDVKKSKEGGKYYYCINLSSLTQDQLSILLQQKLTRVNHDKVVAFAIGSDVVGRDQLLDRPCSGVREMSYVLQAAYANDELKYNIETKLGKRWYAMKVTHNLQSGFMGDSIVFIANVSLSDGGDAISLRFRITENHFFDQNGDPAKVSARAAMERIGIRPLTLTDQPKLILAVQRAYELGTRVGEQVVIKGDVIAKNSSWTSFFNPIEEIKFGTDAHPRRAIIEPELELGASNDYDLPVSSIDTVVLPLVRVFSTDLKRYVYADMQDVMPYRHDEQALDKLVLPDNIMGLVRRLFESHVDQLFGDILSFKHGGMIICAAGSTGIGKTMTAECFAEHSRRPLYTIELGELGTQLDEIEDRLRTIFNRAKRWNAVLLLDEADVMFQKRDDNLERSAIVGVFLRLLDYYSGFLFLTTNRLETLDPAFESRITLTIRYPELTREAREKIWSNMFMAAEVKLPDDENFMTCRWLSQWNINGRRIRSLVRLARMLYGQSPTHEQLSSLMELTVGKQVSCEAGDISFKDSRPVLGSFESEANSDPDLSAYENPHLRLSPQSYQEWLVRLKNPTES